MSPLIDSSPPEQPTIPPEKKISFPIAPTDQIDQEAAETINRALAGEHNLYITLRYKRSETRRSSTQQYHVELNVPTPESEEAPSTPEEAVNYALKQFKQTNPNVNPTFIDISNQNPEPKQET